MSPKLCLCIGAMLGAIGVSLGALGAHGLKTHLHKSLETLHEQSVEYADAQEAVERKLANWETAARYQMIHALALLAVGLLMKRGVGRCLSLAAWAFIAGVLMFSRRLVWICFDGSEATSTHRAGGRRDAYCWLGADCRWSVARGGWPKMSDAKGFTTASP